MKSNFVSKLKRNIHPKKPLGEALIIGGIGSSCFYLSVAIFGNYLTIHLDSLFFCALVGILGGGLPEIIFLAAHDNMIVVRSWAMVAILLLLLPLLGNIYLAAFVYGYLAYLLNTARVKGLPNI